MRIKSISRFVLAGFYLFAGFNHFRDPGFYYDLIPDYIGYEYLVNDLAGIFEMLFGAMLLVPKTRKWASYGIIVMLIAFIPSHVYFIQLGSCVPDGLCAPEWVGWARLVVVHPLLMAWAWWHSREIKK